MSAFSEIAAGLPTAVAAALDQALAQLPQRDAACIRLPDNEGALNHVLLIQAGSDRAVLRMRRAASSREIFDYLGAMYVHTGFPELDGVFRLRGIDEEIAFMHQAQVLGLPVPRLLAEGGDWMLLELIEGRTAYAAVKDGDLTVVDKVVAALHQAHQHGVIYGDRWGDNEVIDPAGRVRPIDFDVEWAIPDHRPGFLEAMEVGVYLFNALRLTSDRPGLLALALRDLVPRLRDWGYRMDHLGRVVDGLGRFYLDPDKPGNQWSLPVGLYQGLAEPLAVLVAEIGG